MITAYQQFDLFGKKTFEKAVMEAPYRFTYEMPNEACFFYMIAGTCDMLTPSKKAIVETQEGVAMQCGNYLANIISNDASSNYCEAIAVHFYPEVLKSIYDKDFPDFLANVDKIKPIGVQKHTTSTLLKTYIDSLQFYFSHPELVSEELLKLKLKELILLLAKTDNLQSIKTLLGGLFSPLTIDFKTVIEANLYNNLSLEELAKLTNLSLSSFKREFVRHYSTSPAKYIRKRKLEQAAKLLKGTNLRVTDIAYDCGFVDLAHFSKTFQKVYKCTPSDYRLN